MPQLPTELLNSIGVALEMVVAVLTALIVAFWISLAIWTLRDIRSRTRDFFAWLLATILVLVAGPIGLLLYVLLRPRETLAQVYDRQLEEEALLRDITTRRACPSCQTVTEPDWLMCPHCRKELRRTCFTCGKALELDWVVCPFCTTPVGQDVPAISRAPEGAADPSSWGGLQAQDQDQDSTPSEPISGSQPALTPAFETANE